MPAADPTSPDYYIGAPNSALSAPSAPASAPANAAAAVPASAGYYLTAPATPQWQTDIPADASLPLGAAALGAQTAYGFRAPPPLARNLQYSLQRAQGALGAAQSAQAPEVAAAAAQHAQFADGLAQQISDEKAQQSAIQAALHRAWAQHARLNAPPEFQPPSSLTSIPLGGEGTANYAVKFGATPVEAARVPSMSVMQQGNIPQQAQAWQKIEGLAPGTAPVQESPLLLPPGEAQAAALQRAQESAIAAHDIATAKAAAQANIDQLTKASTESANRIKSLTGQLTQHMNTPPPAVAPSPAVEDAAAAARDIGSQYGSVARTLRPAQQALLEKLAASGAPSDTLKYLPDLLRGGAGFAGRMLSKLAVPAAVAMVPSEAQQAWEQAKQGNWGHAATEGLGALGGTALGVGAGLGALGTAPEWVPALGMAGAIAGLAPLAQSAYDWYEGPK